jgi:uncharacterized damage-inducible protein DinB
MNQQTKALSKRIEAFGDKVIAFTKGLSDDQWTQICPAEQWSVGVTARHIGNHLGIFELAAMIVRGDALPPRTMDDINARSNKDSADHAGCTKAETLDFLKTKREGLLAFLKGLSDEDLARKGSMPAFNGEVTVAQLLEYVVFQSAAEHFESLSAAVAK